MAASDFLPVAFSQREEASRFARPQTRQSAYARYPRLTSPRVRVIIAFMKPEGAEETDQEPNERANVHPTNNRPHWADAVIAVFTILIFLTYITSDYFLWKQMRLTQKSLNDSETSFAETLAQMRAQTKAQVASANAAGKAAEAMAAEVNKLKSAVAETHALVMAAQTANTNAVSAERPWIGASIQVEDFEPGKVPVYAIRFVNTGRRPARVTLTAGFAAAYSKFPEHPPYLFDTAPSTSILTPGGTSLTTWRGKSKLTAADISIFRSGPQRFFVYGEIDYSDIGSDKPFWTHVCSQYMPSVTPLNDGFVNCSKYNEAQ